MKISKKWVHTKLRIPQAEDGEEVLEKAPPPAAGALPGEPGAPGAAGAPRAPGAPGAPGATPAPPPGRQPAERTRRAEMQTLVATLLAGMANRGGPPRDLVDELVDEQTAQWQPLLGPFVEPLLAEIDKAVSAGETLEAFAARLPQLVMGMDAQPMTEALARATFSARLAGEADLDLSPPQP